MQKRIKRFLVFMGCLVVIGIGTIKAQTGDAGQPGEFLRYGVGARAMGMGHAFTGMANDASTLYWNPAGLMNVERKEFTSMYTNLFYDSRYTYVAAALPRTLVGPKNGIGVGWVNLNMANFDQRDINNNPMGSFDIYEQALFFSFAREFVSTWGILNYGANIKFIDQGLPGYNGNTVGSALSSDVGLTFRPINAPLFRILSLRYLMPLQLGVSLRNIGQLNVGSGIPLERFPFVFRWGASYSLYFPLAQVNLVYDQEHLKDRSVGNFMGVESVFPTVPLTPSLRAGWNSRSSKLTVGGGFKTNYFSNADVHVDFVYAGSPNDALSNDFRLFLSIDFGDPYDAYYFDDQLEGEEETRNILSNHLHIISQRPNELVNESAEALGGQYDTTNVVRYYRLIGGLKLANEYFNRAKEDLKRNNLQRAQSHARDAVEEYTIAFNNSINSFTDNDFLNFGECLMMLDRYSMAADTIMIQVELPSKRFNYLMAVCYKFQERWDDAIAYYRDVLTMDDSNEKSYRALAFLGLGESLMGIKQFGAAIDTLRVVTHNYYSNLAPDYPRYPSYLDNEKKGLHIIADDAQLYIGECYLKLGDEDNALKSYLKLSRFYLIILNEEMPLKNKLQMLLKIGD